MTDPDLIRLIQERSPEEWTPAELAELKVRCAEAPDVRQALAERLQFDTHLAGSLADLAITVDTILERVKRKQLSARRRKLANILGPLGLMLLLIGLGVWFQSTRTADPAANEVVDATHPDSAVAIIASDDESDDPFADAVDALTAIPETPIAVVTSVKPIVPAPIPPAAEPEPVGPMEPWTAAYAAKAAVWNADSDQLRLDFASAGHDDFPEEEARRWWTNFAGQAFNWGQDPVAGKRIARFQGMAELRLPWRADTLLRMTLLDSAACELFFWRGREGISLRYYTTREPHVWAAYRVTRDDVTSPAVRRISLLSTDSGAFFRSTPGTFDLRVQGELLVLSRGGVPLLIAPLGGLPDSVVLDGQCRFRGISVHRCEPLPLPAADRHRLALGGEQAPATLTWQPTGELPAITSEPLPDGRVHFRWDSRDQTGTLHAVLPKSGLYEAIFQVDAADPGTSLFLGDATGKPLAKLMVQLDQKSQQPTLALVPLSDVKDVAEYDLAAAPVPYLGAGQSVRLVIGMGTVHAWISGDGIQWGHLAQLAVPELNGTAASIGITALPGPLPRSLTLRSLAVRELSGLTALADAVLLEKVPAYAPEELADESLWMHRSLAALPVGAEPTVWLDTCAVQALQRGAQREFGGTLIRRLLDGASTPDADPDRLLAALRDAALLMDVSDEARARLLAERLQTMGLEQLERGAIRPSRKLRASWMQLPIWTISPVKSPLDRLVRNELTAAISRNDWKSASFLAAESQFWNHATIPATPLVESAQALDRLAVWVRAMTADQQVGAAGGDGALPLTYRHPLVQQFNKEGYNLRAELDAALNSQAFDDACRLVTSLGSEEADGLLPDLRDRQLFVSMPTAILTALRDYPEFGTAMNRGQGDSGLVKVRQAMADGLVDVIRAATVQFLGTPAAAEARQWLGDRELAAGKFSEAEAHYRFALDSASLEQVADLKPRLFLAEAWSGKPPGNSIAEQLAGDFNLNGRLISPPEFAALLQEARTSHNHPPPASTMLAGSQPPIAPAGYKLEPRGQFDGHSGNNPGRSEFRFGDPFGKQLSYAVDDKLVYLSNRFQVNAYDPASGQVKWAQGVGSEQGEAYDFAFHTMRPLLHREFVFVRRLTRAGAELCCLKKSDGTIVWKQKPLTHVLTDPVIWQGELCALIGGKIEDDQVQVEFARFDLATGAVQSTQPLVKFRDVWNQAIPCAWTVSERWAACQIGNITACLTPDGIVRWLRKPNWLPDPVDDLATDFRAPEPIVQGDRLLLAAPGSRSVDCIDLPTGRLVWRTVLPELRGIRGLSSSRLVVDVGDGLWGLDPVQGDVIWRKPLGTVLEAWAVDDKTILCARRGRALTPQHRPSLVWLETETGRELAQTQLETTDREDWQLGPMVPVAGKVWLLGGSGWKDHKREVLELVAVTAQAPAPFVDFALKHWAADLVDADRHGFASVLPTWWPPSDYKSRWQFVPGDVRGETRLMISRTGENQQPTWLTSKLQIPVVPSSLHFRVANQPGQKWRLVVRIDSETVMDRVLDDAATSNNWQDVAVDLAPFAGRSALATAMHGPVDGQPSEALWKRIELIKN